MAKVVGVRHVVLGVRDPRRSIGFYTDVLGMELVSFLEEAQMAFFSFGDHDHDVAVVKVPDDQPVGSSGLSHTAIEIEGGLEQLRELYSTLKARGVAVEMTMDHIVTNSLYFLDPDGNRLEFFTQAMAHPEAKQYMHGVRTAEEAVRPLNLEPVAGHAG